MTDIAPHETPSFDAPGSGGPSAATLPRPKPARKVKQPSLWHVVLQNDDDHSYEYVIEMMQKLFSHPPERSFQIAKAVDSEQRAVCGTFHKELAELKLEQVHGYGADFRIASCKGSMTATLEPAHAGDED